MNIDPCQPNYGNFKRKYQIEETKISTIKLNQLSKFDNHWEKDAQSAHSMTSSTHHSTNMKSDPENQFATSPTANSNLEGQADNGNQSNSIDQNYIKVINILINH